MSDISFAELLQDFNSIKEAEAAEASEAENKEAEDTEATEPQDVEDEEASKEAEEADYDADESEEVKTAAEWLDEVTPGLVELSEKVASVIDSDDDRELFGQCLDSVLLFKTGGWLQEGHGEDAPSIVRMANELYRSVRDA